MIISSKHAYIYNLKLLEDFCKSLWNAVPAHPSSTWNDISLMQGMIYWKLEGPCGPVAFWYEDISHEHELAVPWLQRYVSCISQHLNQHNDDLNIIRFFLWCVPNLVAQFLCVSLRSYISAELRESDKGYPSPLLIMEMYLPLSSLLPFLPTSQMWMVLLWMSQLMKDPSSVINISTDPGFICGFNYHRGAHLLFRWHDPAKWKFMPLTMCISAHQLCR